jgi:hypothetical protein
MRLGRRTSDMATTPQNVLEVDGIELAKALFQAYMTGAATYTPDPVSFDVADKTVTLTPTVGVSVK